MKSCRLIPIFPLCLYTACRLLVSLLSTWVSVLSSPSRMPSALLGRTRAFPDISEWTARQQLSVSEWPARTALHNRYEATRLIRGVDGGSPCHMSIIRNGNVALSNLRKAPVVLSNLRKAPVALSNLRKSPVACH